MAGDNKTLGKFMLDGIPPAPRGVPQVEVSFDIDANGILSVKAVDKATKKEQKITITASTGLSKEEVERMKKDAEMHAEEDKKKRELVELRNNGETMIYTSEKMLKDYDGKVAADKKTEIEGLITALRGALGGEDAAAIKSAADQLSEVAMKVGGEMYQADQANAAGASSAQGGASGADAGSTGEKKDEQGPIDAEFSEKK